MGEAALYPGSPALGQFYIATDGAPQDFWKVVDIARVHTLPAATAPPPGNPNCTALSLMIMITSPNG